MYLYLQNEKLTNMPNGERASVVYHDDVIKGKHFPRYCFLRLESTGHRWIPLIKASDAEQLWCFLWSASEHTIEQTIEMPVIWDAIAIITSHCNDWRLWTRYWLVAWWHPAITLTNIDSLSTVASLKAKSNSLQNTEQVHQNASKNIIWKISSIVSRPQWVKARIMTK